MIKGIFEVDNSEKNENFDWFGPDAATFGDRVAGAREAAGLSQSGLARRIGIKLSTLRSWEEDQSEPRANKLQMLSGLLNVSLPWLLSGKGDGPDGPIVENEAMAELEPMLLELRQMRTEFLAQAEKISRIEKKLRLHLQSK